MYFAHSALNDCRTVEGPSINCYLLELDQFLLFTVKGKRTLIFGSLLLDAVQCIVHYALNTVQWRLSGQRTMIVRARVREKVNLIHGDVKIWHICGKTTKTTHTHTRHIV